MHEGFYSGDYCERFNSQCEKHEDCAKCIFAAYLNSTSNDLGEICYLFVQNNFHFFRVIVQKNLCSFEITLVLLKFSLIKVLDSGLIALVTNQNSKNSKPALGLFKLYFGFALDQIRGFYGFGQPDN